MIENPSELTEKLAGLEHVDDVLQRVNFSGLANNGRADMNIIGEGVQPDKEARLGTVITIISGRQLESADDYGILLGKGVAQAMQLKPGDYITLMVSTKDGALNTMEFEVIGVFQSFARDYDNSAVRIPLAAAQDLIGTSGIHSVVISLDETIVTDTVADQMKQLLPATEFEVKTWYEIADFYRKAVDLYRSQFAVLQLIVLLMVLLSVANSVNMVVYERLGEFGTLQALGNRPIEIFRLVLSENILLGFLGATLGVLLGAGLALLITSLGIEMPPLPNSDVGYTATIYLVPRVVAVAFAIGVASTILAALIPAYRVSRWPVAEALRQNI